MGVTLDKYAVNLHYLDSVFACKDQELFNQIYAHIKNTTLSGIRSEERFILEDIIKQLLYNIIFEGTLKLDFETGKWSKYRNIPDYDEWPTSVVLEAIFAQDPSFEDYNGYKIKGTKIFIEEISSNENLDISTRNLWWQIMHGRALKDDTPKSLDFYSYLYNSEIKKLLESLSFYNTVEGLKHLRRIYRDNPDTSDVIVTERINWFGIFTDLHDCKKDFFCYISY